MKGGDRLRKHGRAVTIVAIAAGLHLYLILTFAIRTEGPEEREDVTIFRMVDVQEYVPPPPEPEPEPEPPEPEEVEELPEEEIAEEVIETEEEIEETEEPPPPRPAAPGPPAPPEIDYLPQHMISAAPQIPTDEVRENIRYPSLANRRRIEGVVYLELYIDDEGTIRDIDVLRDPGYGLGDAAVKAFDGVKVVPAEANGVPVAVRFRFPVRFQLR
ncbi:MAG: energy transducer TonB [bacterium]